MPETGVRYNIADSRRIRRLLSEISPRERNLVVPRVLEEISERTAERVKLKEIARGRGKKAPPLPRKLTSRNAGRGLVGSIAVDRQSATRWAVGSRLRYAPVHELGLGPYPKRAFLQPGAEYVLERQGVAIFRKWFDRVRRGRT